MSTVGCVRRWAIIAALSTIGCRDQAPPHAPPPRFSIVDIHTHLGGVETWPGKKPNFDELTRTMNEMHVELVVDFKAPDNSLRNGVFGARVSERLSLYPDTARFKLFANVPIDDANNEFVADHRPDYPTWVAGILEDAIRRGASGLKIKDQAGAGNGVDYWTHDRNGNLVPFDTSAYDPLWSTAERLGIPVLVHLGGAYKGEHQMPNGGNRDVRWEILMLQRERVLRKHPRLHLIAAHWGGAAGDRPYLAELLEKYPNMYAEGGANQPKAEFATLDSAEAAFFVRYQNQVMFGTDYMEKTFRWLKSYRQRLDMFLPFTERWPLPDSVMAKYYHGNARRLLGRPDANLTPLAHPGFTSTHVLGDTITLDGSASYGRPGSALRYRWRQTDGPRARLVGETSATPRFAATDIGDYAFELRVMSDSATSLPRAIRVNVVSPSGQFVEDSGRVVIEAEHFTTAIARNGQAWSVSRERPGFSGDGYLVAGPERGTVVEAGDFQTKAPELRYTFWVQHPGTYVAYARGMAPDRARRSLHFGLDNEEVRLADRVGQLPVGRWGWARDAFEWDAQFQLTDTTLAVLNIVDPGPHVLNVWMHHDGVMLDRIMLVRAPYAEVSKSLFDPGSGVGPAESAKRNEPR
ncbi:MAG TPA: amidohydrolase family protein [Gemmatimonadaceae bacterium]|nr:amidohydrolase family protein [Gemmatimonadaceae bacterium]